MSQIGDILDELLSAEQRSVAVRLKESTVFVTPLSVHDAELLDRMARENGEHARWIAELMQQGGETPGPRVELISAGGLHFQEMRFSLPALVREQEQLVNHYTLARQRVSGEPSTVRLLTRILNRHQQTIAQLQRLTSTASTGAPS